MYSMPEERAGGGVRPSDTKGNTWTVGLRGRKQLGEVLSLLRGMKDYPIQVMLYYLPRPVY